MPDETIATHAKPEMATRAESIARRRAAIGSQIEQTALRLFEQHGLDAVTVDQIAAEAGISRRTFYRYFESPVSVVAAIPRRLIQLWATQVRQSPQDEPILTSLLLAPTRFPPDDAEIESFTVALAVMRRSPEAWARVNAELLSSSRRGFETFIAERLRAQGQDSGPAGVIAAGLTAIISHIAEETAPQNGLVDPQRLAAALRDFGAMLSSAGLFPPPGDASIHRKAQDEVLRPSSAGGISVASLAITPD